jgi:hypothetical protein
MSGHTRYPGYDVLDKRDTPSWDAVTRAVIDERLAAAEHLPQVATGAAWRVLRALCACIVPQPADRPPVPLAALLDRRLAENRGDGFRHARLPPLREAWRIGLAALDAESRRGHGRGFADLDDDARVALLHRVQRGVCTDPAWRSMPPPLFFSHRVLPDLLGAYYAHPSAWSEIGFGGPANPRGYVRMVANRRDPWEAVEARPGEEARAYRENRRVR